MFFLLFIHQVFRKCLKERKLKCENRKIINYDLGESQRQREGERDRIIEEVFIYIRQCLTTVISQPRRKIFEKKKLPKTNINHLLQLSIGKRIWDIASFSLIDEKQGKRNLASKSHHILQKDKIPLMILLHFELC